MQTLLRRNMATVEFLAQDPVASARSGETPHAVLHRQNKLALRHFAPTSPRRAPVFISMPLINTWTIFDLLPGRSVIEALVQAGVPVYLVDWGRPGDEDEDRDLAYYVAELLGRALQRSVRHARDHYGAEHVDAIGYCVGGTFLSMHLARHTPPAVRRLALLATPIDFHASGRLAVWARPETFPLDTLIDSVGNYPADLMRASFSWLKPSGQTGKWFSLWERSEDPAFRELWAHLEKWAGDNVDFPGEAYRAYVRGCYFDNALIRRDSFATGGGWVLNGSPVDLSRCSIPALVLAAGSDHICPEAAANGLAAAWGGPVTTETLQGGHVGVCVGKRLPARLLAWIEEAA